MKCIVKKFANGQQMVSRVKWDLASEMVRDHGWAYCPKSVWKDSKKEEN